MLVQQMNRLGISSDALQVLGFASIFAFIATWRMAKGSGDLAHAERFCVFVGLWAPTFFVLSGQVSQSQTHDESAPRTT